LRSDACLRGRHGIVTGGGRGIGAAIAHALAELGADLSLMGRDMDRLHDTAEAIRNQFDSRVETYQVDVADLASVQRAFAKATEPFGRTYILVNNAGQAKASGFADMDPDHWKNMIEVNLTSAFYCTQQVLPTMARRGRPRGEHRLDGRSEGISESRRLLRSQTRTNRLNAFACVGVCQIGSDD